LVQAVAALRQTVEEGEDADAVASAVEEGGEPLRRRVDEYRSLFL
jgi:hypothetical protein